MINGVLTLKLTALNVFKGERLTKIIDVYAQIDIMKKKAFVILAIFQAASNVIPNINVKHVMNKNLIHILLITNVLQYLTIHIYFLKHFNNTFSFKLDFQVKFLRPAQYLYQSTRHSILPINKFLCRSQQ